MHTQTHTHVRARMHDRTHVHALARTHVHRLARTHAHTQLLGLPRRRGRRVCGHCRATGPWVTTFRGHSEHHGATVCVRALRSAAGARHSECGGCRGADRSRRSGVCACVCACVRVCVCVLKFVARSCCVFGSSYLHTQSHTDTRKDTQPPPTHCTKLPHIIENDHTL